MYPLLDVNDICVGCEEDGSTNEEGGVIEDRLTSTDGYTNGNGSVSSVFN
jgi:hypothetical protein